MKKPEIIITGDGSTSLYHPDLDETYHSRHGAVRESMHVFIDKGLHKVMEDSPSQISILEIGMGTGLNVWLTLMESEQAGIPITLTTLEPFPLDKEVLQGLNYVEDHSKSDTDAFFEVHEAQWEQPVELSKYFTLIKTRKTLQEFESELSYDLVYYDAFAPAKQLEMWDLSLIQKVSTWCNPRAVFVTYCAMGQLKRDLATAGFEVETLPGPPGKREMVRGTRR